MTVKYIWTNHCLEIMRGVHLWGQNIKRQKTKETTYIKSIVLDVCIPCSRTIVFCNVMYIILTVGIVQNAYILRS